MHRAILLVDGVQGIVIQMYYVLCVCLFLQIFVSLYFILLFV